MKPKVELVVKDHGLVGFFKKMRAAKGGRVRVGVLANSEKGGLRVEGGRLTVAEIAAVNEFGTEDGRIPARSFIRSTFDEKRAELERLGEKLFEMVLDGEMSVERALGLVGLSFASEVKRKITATEVPPPNAPSTVRQKGSSHPLVDTGRMVGAVTWVVEMGEGGEIGKVGGGE